MDHPELRKRKRRMEDRHWTKRLIYLYKEGSMIDRWKEVIDEKNWHIMEDHFNNMSWMDYAISDHLFSRSTSWEHRIIFRKFRGTQ